MNVSIIITFYKGINILNLCIRGILDNTTIDGNIEILIINDNPDESLSETYKLFSKSCDLTIHNMIQNKGYSAACNVGVKLAKHEYIVLMDCDIIPQEHWLNELIYTYNTQSNPGSVSSKIIEADTGKLFGYGIGVHGVDIILYKRHGKLDAFSDVDRNFCMVSSGCLLMKKSLYEELQGQDETFFNADNDLDLTYRIYLSGKTNSISTKSIVYHRGHISGNIRVLPFRQDSKAWLFKKWGNSLSENTLEILASILAAAEKNNIGRSSILISFSNSLFRNDYFKMIANVFKTTFIQKYDLKNKDMLNKIFINDYLSWDICRTNIPMIYFVDDYRSLLGNAFWFKNRVCNDMIIDKNGNTLLCPQECINI